MRSSTRRLAVRSEASLKILRLGRRLYQKSAPVSVSKTTVERKRKDPHSLSTCFESYLLLFLFFRVDRVPAPYSSRSTDPVC